MYYIEDKKHLLYNRGYMKDNKFRFVSGNSQKDLFLLYLKTTLKDSNHIKYGGKYEYSLSKLFN